MKHTATRNDRDRIRIKALILHKNEQGDRILYRDIDIERYSQGMVLTVDGETWTVVDDYEADQMWDEVVEKYIDETILPQIPERYRQYFDHEEFKKDMAHDGRGNSISLYDGEEHEIYVKDRECIGGSEMIFLYRQ